MRARPRDLLPRRLRAPLGVFGRWALASLAGPLQPAVPAGSVVALCHCHEPELVGELGCRLLSLPRGAELHVSSSDAAVFRAWAPFRSRSRAVIHFHETENRGRDLLPFFSVARGLAFGPDTAVLKIHGKRSRYSDQGDWWRRDSLRGLLPGPFAAHRALARFAADPRLALIGAPGAFISHSDYWGENREEVTRAMLRITGAPIAEPDLGFIAGTMFWMRGGFLQALLPHVEPERFPPEPIGRDGTYAHAVERVIGMAALAWGWHIGETDQPTPLTRDMVRARKLGYL